VIAVAGLPERRAEWYKRTFGRLPKSTALRVNFHIPVLMVVERGES
jgi:hypothetical protein